MKTIAIYQNKGGSGKSTLTTNLASMLSLKGFKVLVLDTDAQSNVAVSFGLNPFNFRDTIQDLFIYKTVDLDKLIINVAPNLDIIPSDSNLNTLEFDILLNKRRYPNPLTLLNDKISLFKDSYDYVLIDTPPALNIATLNSLNAADYILIPTALDSYSVVGLINLISTLNDFKEKQNTDFKILGIVPFKVEKNTNLYQVIYPDLTAWSDKHSIKVYSSISKSVKSSDSITFDNKPLMLTNTNNKSTTEYKQLFRQILADLGL